MCPEILSELDLVIDQISAGQELQTHIQTDSNDIDQMSPGQELQTDIQTDSNDIDQISPRQELQTHIQTDGNDIWPHTAQTHNKRTSMESNLVTAQSTAHEPPENGCTYGPKHAGATLLKCF
jgi:hypothetical protein